MKSLYCTLLKWNVIQYHEELRFEYHVELRFELWNFSTKWEDSSVFFPLVLSTLPFPFFHVWGGIGTWCKSKVAALWPPRVQILKIVSLHVWVRLCTSTLSFVHWSSPLIQPGLDSNPRSGSHCLFSFTINMLSFSLFCGIKFLVFSLFFCLWPPGGGGGGRRRWGIASVILCVLWRFS